MYSCMQALDVALMHLLDVVFIHISGGVLTHVFDDDFMHALDAVFMHIELVAYVGLRNMCIHMHAYSSLCVFVSAGLYVFIVSMSSVQMLVCGTCSP